MGEEAHVGIIHRPTETNHMGVVESFTTEINVHPINRTAACGWITRGGVDQTRRQVSA